MLTEVLNGLEFVVLVVVVDDEVSGMVIGLVIEVPAAVEVELLLLPVLL